MHFKHLPTSLSNGDCNTSLLLDQRLRDSIKAITLQNAIEHDGKPRADAVIGKIAALSTEFRSNLKNIVPAIKKYGTGNKCSTT